MPRGAGGSEGLRLSGGLFRRQGAGAVFPDQGPCPAEPEPQLYAAGDLWDFSGKPALCAQNFSEIYPENVQ